MSVNRLFTAERNQLSMAIVGVLNTAGSSAVRRTAVDRQGNGRITLTGEYTGAEDQTVEAEIYGASGTTRRLTTPVFSGVGSGTMSDLAIPGTPAAQEYTVTLLSKGTTSAQASTDLEGHRIVATEDFLGSGGNALHLTVDASGVSASALDATLIEDLPAGTESITGSGWDWDTAYGTADSVPEGAKRLRFGDDQSTTYVSWKAYIDGEWQFYFLPAIRRTYPRGTRVYEVTGARVCTLTDGVSSWEYEDIVTLRDLLGAIASDSTAPVTVESLPSEIRSPDNLSAILDLRLRTDARIDWTSGEGSRYATGLINTSAGGNAVTELVTATCYGTSAVDDAGLGREKWEVRDITGLAATIRTGESFTQAAGRYAFTVPTRLPPGYGESRGRAGAEVTMVSRAEGETTPPVCVKDLILGPDARDMSVSFVYRARPTDTCPCENQSYSSPSGGLACLDPEITSEDSAMGTLSAGYHQRLTDLQNWHKNFVQANTEITNRGTMRSALIDLEMADTVRSILGSTLRKIYEEGIYSWPYRATSTAYSLDEVIQTTKGYKCRCIVAGTSSSGGVVFPTVVGDTVVDGSVTWECISKTPEQAWDDALASIDGELLLLESFSDEFKGFDDLAGWRPSTTYARGDIVLSAYGNSTDFTAGTEDINGKLAYICIAAGGSGSASSSYSQYYPGVVNIEPSHVFGDIVKSGALVSPTSCVWMCLGNPVRLASGGDDLMLEPSGPGTYAGSYSGSLSDYVRRYRAMADDILLTAEIVPDFLDASTGGSTPGGGCWSDPGDANWWEPADNAGGYLPAFTNRRYLSVKRATDGSGDVVSTHEFSFAIVVNPDCVGALKDGDKVTINIGDAGWAPTYQVGDKLYLAVVGASPLYLAGGVDGTNTLLWSVRGSVVGAMPNYSQARESPGLYTYGISFRLNVGGVDNEVGDSWTFGVEVGSFRYRINGGAWSAATNIGTTSIGSGLSLEFSEGAYPSFVSGDSAAFTVLQPHAATNLLTPNEDSYAWDGSTAEVTIDLSAIEGFSALALLMHSLPSTATIGITGTGLSKTVTWRAGPILLLTDDDLPETPPEEITISIANASGGRIGWLWAGDPLDLLPNSTTAAALQRRSLVCSMVRGQGVNPTAALLGSGRGFDLSWGGFVRNSEALALEAAVYAHKALGDLPMAFWPHAEDRSGIELVLPPDEITWGDWGQWQDAEADGCIDLSLELSPWLTAP
jgi:hypothetical protein